MELLLLSNSTLPGKAWLEHALPLMANQLNGRRSAVFIPFAGVTQTWDEYTDKTAEVLTPLGINVTGIHRIAAPLEAIEKSEIIIVGGGNTFQLLKESRERGLLAPIADRVKRGALYIGWSAGANLACPTIRTTNDMPIVDPNGFDALDLFPLQINPHFTNALPEGHKGETREQRIRELLVVAPELTVIGLPEGNWIQVSNGQAVLGGPNTTWVFKAGEEAVALEAGHRF
ncbi:dipeptidase PepE [Salmonella enterica subsp. enterica]|nr:dipeptidase PepE [Salmonella enterica subsp. enterica]EFO7943473.1 dipeptidase PepE [Salmonella enterica]EGC6330047.1 dipeptidase PepE [Salmonella enterica]EGV2164223.1 dipeptidase PepE [Salmonella enterica]EHF4916861.1 dipeptidase PepE [Salmonella enterica]